MSASTTTRRGFLGRTATAIAGLGTAGGISSVFRDDTDPVLPLIDQYRKQWVLANELGIGDDERDVRSDKLFDLQMEIARTPPQSVEGSAVALEFLQEHLRQAAYGMDPDVILTCAIADGAVRALKA